MLRLVKTEIAYFKIGLIVPGVVGLFCAIFAFSWGLDRTVQIAGIKFGFIMPQFGDMYSLMASTAVALFIAMVIFGEQTGREKRDRMLARLPVSMRTIGIARLLLVALFQLFLLLIWLLFYRIEHVARPGNTLMHILFANAALLAIILLFVMWHDLGFHSRRIYRSLLLTAVGVIIMAESARITDLLTNPADQQDIFLYPFLQTADGTLTAHAVLASVAILSYFAFIKRRSFLQ